MAERDFKDEMTQLTGNAGPTADKPFIFLPDSYIVFEAIKPFDHASSIGRSCLVTFKQPESPEIEPTNDAQIGYLKQDILSLQHVECVEPEEAHGQEYTSSVMNINVAGLVRNYVNKDRNATEDTTQTVEAVRRHVDTFGGLGIITVDIYGESIPKVLDEALCSIAGQEDTPGVCLISRGMMPEDQLKEGGHSALSGYLGTVANVVTIVAERPSLSSHDLAYEESEAFSEPNTPKQGLAPEVAAPKPGPGFPQL